MPTELSESLMVPEYIPDQSLYPGKTFSSYAEMKEACPELDERKEQMDKMGIAYTPYVCRFPGDE
ncbi:MAG: hypothetical protein ABFD07_14135 [Methanobacterium sp.]